MGWVEKVGSLDNIFIFCETQKTRNDIRVKFNLSNIESWHACKCLSGFKDSFDIEKGLGKTGKAFGFTLTKFDRDDIYESLKIGKTYICTECTWINRKDTECTNCTLNS